MKPMADNEIMARRRGSRWATELWPAAGASTLLRTCRLPPSRSYVNTHCGGACPAAPVAAADAHNGGRASDRAKRAPAAGVRGEGDATRGGRALHGQRRLDDTRCADDTKRVEERRNRAFWPAAHGQGKF